MTEFTELELAALHSIFLETLELAPALEQQLAVATVVKRENSGGGFFTTISVDGDAPRVIVSDVLGFETQARVKGLEHGFYWTSSTTASEGAWFYNFARGNQGLHRQSGGDLRMAASVRCVRD